MAETPEISGAEDFVRWFGDWPSFHDAEVISVFLSRAGSSEIKVHCFRGTSELDERGLYRLTHHALVSFHFDDVLDCELSAFNQQNVLSGVEVVQYEHGHELILGGCYGLEGSIRGKGLRLTYSEGRPDEGVYSEP